jgi:hypothetical protein
MTRPLAMTKRQAQAIIRAAKAEGVPVEVKFGELVLLLNPAGLDRKPEPVDDGKDWSL